ncbi:MAG: hypothetical protein AAGJ81_10740 [Verrucomicrobiota bacterium]
MKQLILVASCLVVFGCATTNSSQRGVVNKNELVRTTALNWLFLTDDREYLTKERFFAEPPTERPLIELQAASEFHGYDFVDLQQRTWDRVKIVEHVGE